MIPVISYIRFSRLEQRKGDSFRRQLEYAREWIARNPDHYLDETLRTPPRGKKGKPSDGLYDLGRSAFRGKHRTHGALGYFFHCIKDGTLKPPAVLLIESVDRLSREPLDTATEVIRQILRAQIKIVTIKPEREYTAASLDDLASMVELQVYISRAHEESQRKSERCGAAWDQRQKKAMEKQQPLTMMCPAWLRIVNGKYELITEHAKTLRLLAKLSVEGMGVAQLARYANQHNILPVGKGPWRVARIGKLLRDRRLIGDYQRFKGNGWFDRRPVGDPVPGVYPRVLTDDVFYKLQAALDSRKRQRGRISKAVANLFQGLLYGRDGGTYFYHYNGNTNTRAHLKPDKHYNGLGGSRVTFPYISFEQAMLSWLQVTLKNVLSNPNNDTLTNSIAEIEGQIADRDHRLKVLKERLKKDGDLETLADTVAELEGERRMLKEQLAPLRQELATRNEPQDACSSLITAMNEATKDELYTLRLKLKQKIRQLIQRIEMELCWVDSSTRRCEMDILLHNGMQVQQVLSQVTGEREATVEHLGVTMTEAQAEKIGITKHKRQKR